MKNMKIKAKLLLCFIIMAILTSIVGILSIYGLTVLTKSNEATYNDSVVSLQYIAQMAKILEEQRTTYRDVMLFSDDPEYVAKSVNKFNDLDKTFQDMLANYQKTVVSGEEVYAKKLKDIYTDQWLPEAGRLMEIAKAGDMEQSKIALSEAATINGAVISALDEIIDFNITFAKNSNVSDTQQADTLMLIQICVMAGAIIIALLFGIIIARSISNPIQKLVTVADAIAVGDISTDIRFDRRDELGALAQSFTNMIDGNRQQIALVEAIAGGDLAVDIPVRSKADAMNVALKNMLDANNRLFLEITEGSQNVTREAGSISNGSQLLAQGATEQAAAVEELSSSISDIAKMTRSNAEMALKANDLAKSIMSNAETGNVQMGNMMNAVQEINTASQSISKVIKAIDDIAFQTNILALNAAVEAARAGQHGKGFAVVAEEVRSLAGKSAEAAKDTADLIANSIDKAELGSRIAAETASSLQSIVNGITESSAIISEIATYSNDQATAIDQVNKGIDQVAQVVQANSATSQEAAASASEMSDQASHLSDLMQRFTLRQSHATSLPQAQRVREIPAASAHPAASSKPAMPMQEYPSGAEAPVYTAPDNYDGFGKY